MDPCSVFSYEKTRNLIPSVVEYPSALFWSDQEHSLNTECKPARQPMYLIQANLILLSTLCNPHAIINFSFSNFFKLPERNLIGYFQGTTILMLSSNSNFLVMFINCLKEKYAWILIFSFLFFSFWGNRYLKLLSMRILLINKSHTFSLIYQIWKKLY